MMMIIWWIHFIVDAVVHRTHLC